VVPLGAPVQLKGGETPKLSQVYFFGYLPLLTNALLLATKLELTVVVDELVSFLQEALKRQTKRMSTDINRLIAMCWILSLIKGYYKITFLAIDKWKVKRFNF
jgi:hypothetical protein